MLLFHPKLVKITGKRNLANTLEPCQMVTWVQKVLRTPCLDVVMWGYAEGCLEYQWSRREGSGAAS